MDIRKRKEINSYWGKLFEKRAFSIILAFLALPILLSCPKKDSSAENPPSS
jgi:hypothetical protein